MKLPHAEQAVVDIVKLRDYCLSQTHPRGRHKARVFAAALGIKADNANLLKDALLEAAQSGEAVSVYKDEFGERFMVDFELQGVTGIARVRSIWILPSGEQAPRLITCFVV